jgi:hypothetical protein
MAFDPHANLAVSAVATAPNPPTSGTSLTVNAGEGSRFPVPPFNVTVWPAGAAPTPANAEILRVTARATDTLTLLRAQESTAARAIGFGDQIAATITAKTLTDVETQAALLAAANVFTARQTISDPSVAALGFIESGQATNQKRFQILGTGMNLYVQPSTDADAGLLNALILDRQGNVKIGADISEKGRATPLGHWTNVPNNPADFTVTGGGGGTVAVAGHFNRSYTLIGKTCLYGFHLQLTITGTPLTVRIALPSGIVCASPVNGTFGFGTSVGMIATTPSVGVLDLYINATFASPWTAGTYYVTGTLAFQIQ